MSRGFLAALIGIAMTLLAWYGPWGWPAWPAFAAIDLAFGSHTSFADLPYAVRASIVVLLIVLNSGVWGAIGYAVLRSLSRLRDRLAPSEGDIE